MSRNDGNQVTKTNFNAVNQILVLDVARLNTVRFEFSGVYNFAAAFESSSDTTDGIDGTWFPLRAGMTNSSTNSTSHATANATQAYEASCHSVAKVRVKLSSFGSAGIHLVQISGTDAAIAPAPATTFPSSQLISTPAGLVISVVTAASTNSSVQKSIAGSLFELSISNPTATAISVKLYNKTTAPTVGTDVPVLTQTVAGGAIALLNFGQIGKRFALGIGIAATALPAATDTGVAVAGVQIHGSYL